MRLRSLALVPLYPETYAMTFPRGKIVRLRARAFTLLISEIRVHEDGVNVIYPRSRRREGSRCHAPAYHRQADGSKVMG